MTRLRQFLAVGLTVAILALFMIGSAAAQTPQVNDEAGFTRFVHTAVDAPAVDIYLGSGTTPLVTNLAYGQMTDFMALPTNLSGYAIRAAGSPATSDPLFRLDWGVKANKSELVAVVGTVANKNLAIEPFTLVRNDTNGKARVRVLNTVSSGTLLSVSSTQGAAFSQGQKFLNAAPDVDVEPGSYTFQVKDNNGKVLATSSALTLAADELLTLLIIGSADGNQPIALLPVENSPETARLKIVNETSAALDVYLKGKDTAFAPALAANSATDFSAVPAGSVTIVARKAGSGATSQELAALPIQLRPYRDVTITISSTANGGLQIAVTSDTLNLPLWSSGETGSALSGNGTLAATGTVIAGTAAGTMPAATLSVTATASATMPATISPTGDATRPTQSTTPAYTPTAESTVPPYVTATLSVK